MTDTTAIPRYLAELRALTGDETLTLDLVESAIEAASSDYNHLLDLYLAGKLPTMEVAWRLMALRRGIEPVESAGADQEVTIALRNDPDITVQEIAYASTVSDLDPLYAEVCFDPRREAMPIVVIQHGGNPGSRYGTVPSCYRMAKKGLFAISVSKRGRDGSAGENDSWAVETFDIIDAIEHVKREYAPYVDATNVNIWGYSGGCVDSVAAAVRFPGYFRLVAPYFGQLEFTRMFADVPVEDRRRHAQQVEERKGNSIIDGIGGFPDEVPDRYLARDLILGAINNPYSQFHFFLDARDPSGPILQTHFDEYVLKAEELGFTNVHLHRSGPGDAYRFHHMHPGARAELGNPDLMVAESFYVQHILHGTYPQPVLADGGRMNVLGFVQTERFSIWLGSGEDAVAELEYTLTGRDQYFAFRPLSSDPTVRGRLTVPNPEGHRWGIAVSGSTVSHTDSSPLTAEFDLDDTVVFRRIA